MQDYTEVQTTIDLGEPGDPDYVPAGSRGELTTNIGSLYPYTIRFFNAKLMPWLVSGEDFKPVDSKAAVS